MLACPTTPTSTLKNEEYVANEHSPTPTQSLIGNRIQVLRQQHVMLDSDLAELYEVQTKVLVQAVKRNLLRFPADFMFQLEKQDLAILRSQTVTSSLTHGGRRTAPYAFTEQGVAMLSSVLNSPRAIAVNIEIIRTFVRVRKLAATHQDLAKRLADLEEKTEAQALQQDTFAQNTRTQLKQVFEAIRQLMIPPEPSRRPIGFVTPEANKKKDCPQ